MSDRWKPTLGHDTPIASVGSPLYDMIRQLPALEAHFVKLYSKGRSHEPALLTCEITSQKKLSQEWPLLSPTEGCVANDLITFRVIARQITV